jgi:outer membrane murein-binding lipoprotein Lpp
MESINTIYSIAGIVLALGAIGAWLLTAGRNMQRNEETAKDVDGLGRKVEKVRQDLQQQINTNKNEHDQLAREVSEIKATTTSTHILVERLVSMHMQGNQSDDGR